MYKEFKKYQETVETKKDGIDLKKIERVLGQKGTPPISHPEELDSKKAKFVPVKTATIKELEQRIFQEQKEKRIQRERERKYLFSHSPTRKRSKRNRARRNRDRKRAKKAPPAKDARPDNSGARRGAKGSKHSQHTKQ